MMPARQFFLIMCALSGSLDAQTSAGFVLEMEGIWTLASASQALSPGQHLPAGSLLRNDSPSDGDRIVVANLTGDVIKRVRCKSGACRECNESGACYDPIHALPSAKPQAGALASSFEAVMDLFFGKPDRYSAHRVRGEALADAVLRLENGHCDLGPAFKNVERGRYYVQLKSLSGEAASPRIVNADPISIDWDPSHPGLISIPGLSPGLYDLILLEKEGSGYATSGVDAWVLVRADSDYGTAASAFAQATAVASKWGESVSPDTARGYLRANLEYLARRPSAPAAQDAKK